MSTHPHRRIGKLECHASVIQPSLDSSPVRSVNEACARIKEVCGVVRKPTRIRHFLKSHGYKFRKMGQVLGKADPVLQEQWPNALTRARAKYKSLDINDIQLVTCNKRCHCAATLSRSNFLIESNAFLANFMRYLSFCIKYCNLRAYMSNL